MALVQRLCLWSYINQLKNDDPGVVDFKVDGRITDIPAVGTDPKPSVGFLLLRSQVSLSSYNP
jgi:hypothetical protein